MHTTISISTIENPLRFIGRTPLVEVYFTNQFRKVKPCRLCRK
jgi:hypothetical protein